MLALLGSFLLATTPLAPLPHSSDLYVSGFFASSVQRYRGPRDASAGPRPAPGQSGASYALPVTRRHWGIAFGPDGNLYVANFGTRSEAIMRVQGPFSATAGAVSTFVDPGAYFDVAFGPDGNLYAANYDSCVEGPNGCTGMRGEIVRFDGLTGNFIDVYVTAGQGGLTSPWDLAFGPDGALYVANTMNEGDGTILRYDRTVTHRRAVGSNGPGTPFATRAGLFPLAIAFGPDRNLYVSTSDNSGSAGSILRFNGATGAFLDVFVTSVDGGPRGITFAPGLR